MIKDQQVFYDKESSQYSKKRYEGALLTYAQFLFRKRLSIFLKMVDTVVTDKQALSVFEIGCADGIILNNIAQAFPDIRTKMVGVDISRGMIEEATAKNQNLNISYAMRGEEADATFDLVVELGVHVPDLTKEIEYIKSRLDSNGYLIYSIASRSSLHAQIKLKGTSYVKEYLTYKEGEAILSRYFTIVEAVPYGLFTPKLWAVPAIGRLLQSGIDNLMRCFGSSLFHEKIYLLKNK